MDTYTNGEWIKYSDYLLEIADYQIELEAIKNRVCEWLIETDKFANNYETGCDNIFTIIEGTPEDNEFFFCPYCGGKIEIKKRGERMIQRYKCFNTSFMDEHGYGTYVLFNDHEKELEKICKNINDIIESYGHTGEDARDMKNELISIITEIKAR